MPLESEMNKLPVDVWLKFVRKTVAKLLNFEEQNLCDSHFEKMGPKVFNGNLVFLHSNRDLILEQTLWTWSKHSHQHDTGLNQETDHLYSQKKAVILWVNKNVFRGVFNTLVCHKHTSNTSWKTQITALQ